MLDFLLSSLFRRMRVAMRSVLTHVHLRRTKSEKDFPRNRIVAIEPVEDRRFRIERHISSDGERDFVRIPNVSRAAERVPSNAKYWVMLRDSQQRAIGRPQQFVFINQFEPRVQ